MNSPVSNSAMTDARRAQHEILGQLAATLAHDFNNVLAAISGSAGLIALDPASAHLPRHLDNIRRAIEGGTGLTRQMQFLHPRSDGPLELVALAPAVEHTVARLRESFGAAYPIVLAAPATPISIRADPVQLDQILLQLCTNARDAMRQGGPIEIAIETVADSGGVSAEIQVRDRGAGIPHDVQTRLFEPFFSTKPKGKGAGLGLSVVSRLVERHGGTVRFASTAGQGTTFSCRFPVAA